MSVDISKLATIQEECSKFEKKLQRYTNKVKESVSAQKAEHETVMAQEKENLQSMNKVAEAKQSELAALKEKHMQEKQNLDDIMQKLFALKEQCQELPGELGNKRQELMAIKDAIDAQHAAYDAAMKENEYKTNELTLGREFYRKYLGLDFKRAQDNRLRFVFTNVDENDHARPFSFSVFINKDNKYELVECQPSIPNVVALLDQLNSTNDFSRFVHRMRAKFRDIALQQY